MAWNRTEKATEHPKFAIGLDASIGVAVPPAAKAAPEIELKRFEFEPSALLEEELEPAKPEEKAPERPPLDPRLTRSYLFLPVPEEALGGKHPVDFGSDEAA
ncbi:MAG TPA: hypothetical protein VG820_11195, partial [Fimbriimonadaceae bacterium]|nr:hypothetical protein [Fimbriimonadaceae bacterium]